jgi:cytochrome P450/NADPH-cytochrome P450 reductase
LPKGITYQPGDHLGVLPRNSTALVLRVAKRFNLNPGVVLQITKIGEGNTTLPIDQKIRLQNLLEDFVELQEIITRKQLKTLIDNTVCPPEKNKLVWLLQDDVNGYMKHILEKRRSLVDVLEEFPACEIPFATFLELLPSLRPRYYSISSSHHQYPQFCSITVSVLDVPAKSGNGNYKGTCSNFLATTHPGNYIDAFTKEPVSQFRLPADASIPIIMVGPGTGYAPFRGFLQERQWLKDSGNPLGKALLFYGCRHSEQDFIYREELHAFENNGIAQVVTAFSRQDDQPKEYVQHKMWQHKEEVWQMIEEGGIVYICGDGGKMEPDVRNTLEKIYKEKTGDTTNSWVNTLITQQRYLTDVWVSY